MLVERRLQVTKKKTASGLSMKTLEGTISYADQENVDRKVRLVYTFLDYFFLSRRNPSGAFPSIKRLSVLSWKPVADVSFLVYSRCSRYRNDKRSQRNVPLSTKKSLRNSEFRKLSFKTLSSVIKKNRTGHYRNLPLSRRSLMTFSRQASESDSIVLLYLASRGTDLKDIRR